MSSYLKYAECRKLHHWEWPTKAGFLIHLDFAWSYVAKVFLVLTDIFSKYLDVAGTCDIETKHCFNWLFQVYCFPFRNYHIL